MSTLVIEVPTVAAQQVQATGDELTIALTDGRRVSVPLAWYPRLLHSSPAERNHWRLIADGEGIHWPDLDEDISVSVEGLALGRSLWMSSWQP